MLTRFHTSQKSDELRDILNENMTSTPVLPQQGIEPRNLWPVLEGNAILQSFVDKQLKIEQLELESWQVNVGCSWRLLSRQSDVFFSANVVRQQFVELTKVQQAIERCFSNQRCVAIVEEIDDEVNKWRIWQIVRQEASLADLLRQDVSAGSSKKTAEMFFIVAEKFYSVVKLFLEKEIFISFNLDNIGLQRGGGVIFIGFLPEHGIQHLGSPVLKQVEQAFIEPVAELLIKSSAAFVQEIMRYLDIYAKGNLENEALIQTLKTLMVDGR